MAQHFSRQPLRTPPQPFSEGQGPAPTSSLLWSRLWTYRPLLLLGGLWITFVCVSAIAYQGLMFNEPIEDSPYADSNYTEAPLSIKTATPEDLAPAPDLGPPEATAAQSGTVILWGLLSLVGLCAFGCFVLTQQIKASARPKRKKTRPVAKIVSPARPPQPKRLTPYSPERDSLVVPGARVVETLPPPSAAGRPAGSVPPQAAVPQTRVLPPGASAPTRPQARPQTGANSPRSVSAVPLPQPRTPAVVSDEADLALDYPEGSVAHALDVRQRRSLSSFM
jgi:hypothetical protein